LISGVLGFVEKSSLVFIEDYAFRSKSKQSALATMGEIGGLLRYTVWRKTGIWPLVVGIGQWKKWLTGVGKGRIEDFKLQLYKRRGLEFSTVDEGVAYLICEIGHALTFGSKSATRYQEDILKTIRRKLKKDGAFMELDLLSDD